LTDIFVFTTKLTDASSFIYTFVAFPFEYGKWAEANTALLPKILFEHPNIGVLSIAFIAGDWEIR
jgi:hypothetical protein